MMLVSLLPVVLLLSVRTAPADSAASPPLTFHDTDPITGASLECDRCPPGTYLRARCTSTKKSQCDPCPSGSFTELWNYIGKCLRCGVCGQNQVEKTACTAYSDCQCECKQGYYYMKRYDMCVRHSDCPAGQGVLSTERHSLTYIYSALSKDLHLPGIHNFTAMRLLNGRMISYFDSNLKKLVSKQKWVEERLPPDHWAKTTFICQEEQEKFYSILNSLMGQNNSDVHTLQYMRGCEADEQPDGQLKFHRGLEMYRYDGEDFLSFNSTNLVWDASVKAAEGIMRKWNENYSKNEKIKGYLENQCLQWLTKFREYQLQQLKTAPPPEVFMFAREAKVETNIILSCWATGFYPKHIILNIKRDGRILTHQDGVMSSGVRPNEDDTYQRRDDVEILRSDEAKFTCEVIHRATSVHVEKEWDHKVSGSGGLGIGIGVVAGILLLVGVAVVFFLFKRGIINGPRQVPLSNNTSGASSVESVVLMLDKVSNASGGSGDSGVSSSNGANGQNGTPESEAFLQDNGDAV